jgi:hypothetical protein
MTTRKRGPLMPVDCNADRMLRRGAPLYAAREFIRTPVAGRWWGWHGTSC